MNKNECVNCKYADNRPATIQCPHCSAWYCVECYETIANDAMGCVECEKVIEDDTVEEK